MEKQLKKATFEKTEDGANFGEISEKYFTAGRFSIAVDGDVGQHSRMDHEEAPEGESH